MHRHTRRAVASLSRLRKELLAAVLLLALFTSIAAGPQSRQPFNSAEVKFTDASAHGLSIVPASCPSDPHYHGECDPAPPPPPPPPPGQSSCTLTLSPYSIQAGQSSTLSWHAVLPSSAVWTIRYADGSITPDVGSVGQSGSATVQPVQTTDYLYTIHTCAIFGASASGTCSPGTTSEAHCDATLTVNTVDPGPACPAGYVWDSVAAKCKLICPDGSVQIGDQCVVCPAGSTLVGNQCVTQCTSDPFGTGLDQSNSCLCPDGSFEYNGQCVVCPDNSHFENGQCIDDCPAGTVNQGGQCITPICPAGSHEYNGQCIVCAADQVYYQGQCLTVCPDGTRQQGTECVSTDCPVGYQMVDGQCKFVECPAGYVRNGDTCEVIDCPVGYTRDANGLCTFVQCPDGYIQHGTVCDSAQCEAGFFYCGTGQNSGDLYQRSYGAAPSCTASDSLYAHCDYGCDATAGQCKGAPNGNGAIQAKPQLVRTGDTSLITWQVLNASSCTVTGSNGDSWPCAGSACKNASHLSSPLQIQTTYTLSCIHKNCSYNGATQTCADVALPTTSVTVNIVPIFNEH